MEDSDRNNRYDKTSAREKRLKEALRANLQRRKNKTRALRDDASPEKTRPQSKPAKK